MTIEGLQQMNYLSLFCIAFLRDLWYNIICYRGIVQSVEHQSPKLGVVGSSPSAPAKKKAIRVGEWLFSVKFVPYGTSEIR